MLATALIVMLFGLETEPVCFSSDVQRLCCPGACAAKNGKEWPRANEVLQACAKSIGCKGVDGWTVGMHCNCPPKGSGAS